MERRREGGSVGGKEKMWKGARKSGRGECSLGGREDAWEGERW